MARMEDTLNKGEPVCVNLYEMPAVNPAIRDKVWSDTVYRSCTSIVSK